MSFGGGFNGGGGAPPVADTTLKRLALTPDALTGSSATSALDIAQTWNTTGSPTLIKGSVTNTASGAASLLLDLQVGGVSKIQGKPNGSLMTNYYYTGAGGGIFIDAAGYVGQAISFDAAKLIARSNFKLQWGSSSSGFHGSETLTLCRAGAAQLQLGTDHATTPTTQTIKAHDVTTGDAADLLLAGGTSGGGGSNGMVRIGTHSAVGSETVTGYIEIKDAGGTVRKLAVIS